MLSFGEIPSYYNHMPFRIAPLWNRSWKYCRLAILSSLIRVTNLALKRTRKNVTNTIVTFILLFAGIYFIWSGTTTQSTVRLPGGFEISTSSVGLVILFFVVILLILGGTTKERV